MTRRRVGSVLVAVVLAACASFSESGDGPSPAAGDASTDGSEDGATVSDAGAEASDDPCEGFVPPKTPADPKHVDCGSESPDTDTTTNSKNCGQCGHDCRSGVCSGGACTTETVFDLGLSQSARPFDLDAEFLYVVNDNKRSELFRTSIKTLTPNSREVVATIQVADASTPGDRLFHSGRVADGTAWLRGSTHLLRTPVGSLDPAIDVHQLPQSFDAESMGVGKQHVFAVLSDRIISVDVTTNEAKAFVGLPPNSGTAELVVPADEKEIFWGTTEAVFRKRGSEETRVSDTPLPETLRLDDLFVYWIEKDTRKLQRVRRNAPANTKPSFVSQLAPAGSGEAYLALGAIGGYVYFVEYTGAVSGTNSILRRVHRCGGDPVTLTQPYGNAGVIFVDGTHVYFALGEEVRRVPR